MVYRRNTFHMFLFFPIATQLWSKVHKWIGINLVAEVELMEDNQKRLRQRLKRRVRKNFQCLIWLTMCWWVIWIGRNEKLFKDNWKEIDEMEVLAKDLSWEWFISKYKEHKEHCWLEWSCNPLVCISK